MKVTHYAIRLVKALDVPASEPVFDVAVRTDENLYYHSNATFATKEAAEAWVTTPAALAEQWGDHPIRAPHDLAPLRDNKWMPVYQAEAEEPVGEMHSRVAALPPFEPSPNLKAENAALQKDAEAWMERAQRSEKQVDQFQLVIAKLRSELRVYHSDCEIKVCADTLYGDDCITLWRIRGVPRTLYPTKMAAEVGARAHFPHEDAALRYGRISFTEISYEENI